MPATLARLCRSATMLAASLIPGACVTGIGGPPAEPDGELTVDDIIAFFNAFSDGC